MELIIKRIISKAQQEGFINGNYVLHFEDSKLFLYNVKLDDGMKITIPIDLIQDFEHNSSINVSSRLVIN